jgi:hypothetical protein
MVENIAVAVDLGIPIFKRFEPLEVAPAVGAVPQRHRPVSLCKCQQHIPGSLQRARDRIPTLFSPLGAAEP